MKTGIDYLDLLIPIGLPLGFMQGSIFCFWTLISLWATSCIIWTHLLLLLMDETENSVGWISSLYFPSICLWTWTMSSLPFYQKGWEETGACPEWQWSLLGNQSVLVWNVPPTGELIREHQVHWRKWATHSKNFTLDGGLDRVFNFHSVVSLLVIISSKKIITNHHFSSEEI